MTPNRSQLVLILVVLICFSVSTCCLCSPQTDFSILGHDSKESTLEEQPTLEERLVELFQRWREKHGKTYRDMEEMEKRFENFRENFKYVIGRTRDLNSMKTPKHEVGLNEFADLSNEEFREVYLSKIGRPIKHQKITELRRMEGRIGSCEAPPSLDWRKRGIVTGVKNQKQCGSCWAFSSIGAIEGINAIATGNLISLSEQELVDCDSTCSGCGGGNMDSAFEWVINNGGIDTESGYPYKAYDGTCNITKEETAVVTIDGYEDVAQEENAILCAVAKQPVSVGIDGSAMDFQLYTGGIYEGECSSNPNDIDHALLIVGYGSENYQDYWIVKNSWGTNWGIEGYIFIKRNTELPFGVCAINAMASYPTKNSESPSPFPPPVNPPPPPPPSQPPPSPYPCPTQCGETTYCSCGSTCCCMFEVFGVCLLHGCCEYENAVCCADSIFCCPHDYPICDIDDGLCLQSYGDIIGLAAKKRKMAKYKLPWLKLEDTVNASQQLLWKRRQFVASS